MIYITAFSIGFIIGFALDLCFHKAKCKDCVCKEVYEFETGNKFS